MFNIRRLNFIFLKNWSTLHGTVNRVGGFEGCDSRLNQAHGLFEIFMVLKKGRIAGELDGEKKISQDFNKKDLIFFLDFDYRFQNVQISTLRHLKKTRPNRQNAFNRVS